MNQVGYYPIRPLTISVNEILVSGFIGVDRVVFGIDWQVSWILSLESLAQEEKEAILWKNLEKLLDI
jgi:hypothetical protein